MRYALSYFAQQVSGLWSWVKDGDHIEKAFDFAGMGTRNGVEAVGRVQSGMTGAYDVLDGTHILFIALSTNPKSEAMLDGLGTRFYVSETAIKTYSVRYPIQSPLDALLFRRARRRTRCRPRPSTRNARDLMVPVLGACKTSKLIEMINHLETLKDIRGLRLLTTA